MELVPDTRLKELTPETRLNQGVASDTHLNQGVGPGQG